MICATKTFLENKLKKHLLRLKLRPIRTWFAFDDKSPFVTSGIRFGTAAITTRGLKAEDMEPIVSLIDEVIQKPENENVIEGVAAQVHKMMAHRPLFNV